MNATPILFFDVDTQRDFVDATGSLSVPGAETIRPKLARLTRFALDKGLPLIATADAHAAGDPEFAQFPPHCVRGSPGQEKIAETALPRAAVVPNHPLPESEIPLAGPWLVEKTIFSAFGNPNIEALLRKLSPKLCAVYGVATDYCVKAAAEGLRERGYEVVLVEDAIAGVAEASTQAALESMAACGVRRTKTDQLLAEWA